MVAGNRKLPHDLGRTVVVMFSPFTYDARVKVDGAIPFVWVRRGGLTPNGSLPSAFTPRDVPQQRHASGEDCSRAVLRLREARLGLSRCELLNRRGVVHLTPWLDPQLSAPFTVSFFGEGSPTKIVYLKKGTRILTSLLEDLVALQAEICSTVL